MRANIDKQPAAEYLIDAMDQPASPPGRRKLQRVAVIVIIIIAVALLGHLVLVMTGASRWQGTTFVWRPAARQATSLSSQK